MSELEIMEGKHRYILLLKARNKVFFNTECVTDLDTWRNYWLFQSFFLSLTYEVNVIFWGSRGIKESKAWNLTIIIKYNQVRLVQIMKRSVAYYFNFLLLLSSIPVCIILRFLEMGFLFTLSKYRWPSLYADFLSAILLICD
jgi:hypothetical protein